MEIVKQELIDLEWSSRLNLDPDRGDEEGKGGKYLENENIFLRMRQKKKENILTKLQPRNLTKLYFKTLIRLHFKILTKPQPSLNLPILGNEDHQIK